MRGFLFRLAVVGAAILAVCAGAKAVAAYADAHAWDIAVLFVGAVM
jgi:hypothetical protein